MSNHAEVLKTMLQDIINDRQEQASITMHDYFVSKTKEISGLGSAQPSSESDEGLDIDQDQDQDQE